MTSKTPTADDFRKAYFAARPDGLIAVRLLDAEADHVPWITSYGGRSDDADMAEGDWKIVYPVTSLADIPDAVRAVGYRTEGPIPEGVPYARVTSDGFVAAHSHGSFTGWSEDQMSGWPGDFYLYEPPRPEGAAEIEEIIGQVVPTVAASLATRIADALAEAGVTTR